MLFSQRDRRLPKISIFFFKKKKKNWEMSERPDTAEQPGMTDGTSLGPAAIAGGDGAELMGAGGMGTLLPSPSGPQVHIQFFPHSEVPLHQALSRANKSFMFKPIEFDLRQGTLVKFGRKIDSMKESTSRWSRDEQIANNACFVPFTVQHNGLAGGNEERNETSAAEETPTEDTPPTQNAKQLIAFRSKVVSRAHAELWLGKDGQVYFKDIGSSSGTFLNRLRLSPSGKESRPYPLKSGDTLQLGVDYQGRQEEIYKCVTVKVFISTSSGQRNRPKSTK
jgi:hypothetical protein